ncbi:AmmeMemoRadiSam system protein A [Pelomicrobium methylotrophicum]|uniref:AmmeMemoRadiSam system protein A n=1 Tax=Pelomicrobium methylotrophicum TaxID=2602750 RepID=A0A5C7EGD1_9PROT|nr:AmmeMemoRadiSam system protein A [Pelomicrobium methylotrophicum]TXF11301.1 AmmeMemoRadiSam system protein A [Pelomicrobium methylotrophicum]
MSPELGLALLKLARGTIAERFGLRADTPPAHGPLAEPGATFVTLSRNGKLRGCIGSLEARRRLYDDVRDNALGAAFRDPRFPPLAREEFDETRVEVSLLSPLEPLPALSQAELLEQLRPGIDGLVFQYGHHRSTFLPQVWETLPEPVDFMEHLKRKAGLPFGFWADGVNVWRYTVSKWKESEEKLP